MGSRDWYKGMCKFMVSDSASRIVGKRPCSRKPVKNDLCAFHQPEKVKARYDKLLRSHNATLPADEPVSRDADCVLAAIADTVASAHRNSEMISPEFRPFCLDIVRERIWELSYEINRLRALKSNAAGTVAMPESCDSKRRQPLPAAPSASECAEVALYLYDESVEAEENAAKALSEDEADRAKYWSLHAKKMWQAAALLERLGGKQP